MSGPGQRFVTTERLQAGGAYTVRGYDDVTLELLAGQRAPTGRTSLLVLNQEIRFPLFRRFRGAMFWDHANFYGDVDLGERIAPAQQRRWRLPARAAVPPRARGLRLPAETRIR